MRGLGIAREPELCLRDAVKRGELVQVLQAFSPPATPLNFVHLVGRYVTPCARAFIDFVRPRLALALGRPQSA